MEFFGIEMKGPLFLETFDQLPYFKIGIDSGRLIYVVDEQALYYGGNNSWLGLGATLSASTNEVLDGALTNKFVSPKTLRDIKASIAESNAGVDDIKYVTPAGLKSRMDGNPGVIPGTIIYYARNTVPSGYLKANGAAISRTTYSALFSALGTTWGAGNGSTTFNIPDLRGVFIRSLDDGKGIDSERSFGSLQQSSNLSHNHSGNTSTNGNHTHSATTNFCCTSSINQPYRLSGDDSAWSNNVIGNTPGVNPAGDHNHSFTTSSNGGSESRPINISLIPCIKY